MTSKADEEAQEFTLYTLKPESHYCDGARWALKASGIAFAEVGYLPGLHIFSSPVAGIRKAWAAKHPEHKSTARPTSLPLLVAGRDVVADDMWGCVCMRGAVPERAAELLESVVGPATRAIYYSHFFKTAETKQLFVTRCKESDVSWWQRFLWSTPFGGEVVNKMQASIVASADRVAEERKKLKTAVDELGALIGTPPFVLDGPDAPTAAAIAIAAMMYPLVIPSPPAPDSIMPEIDHWKATKVGAFAAAMYEKYPHL